jgi:hypothetical protein
MPMFESHSSRSSVFVRRSAALAAVAGVFALGAHAQQISQPADSVANAAPVPLFAALSTRPMDLATLAGVDYSSSSDSLSPDDVAAGPETLNFLGTDPALQPPPRRRYGRPRYNDSSHNSDGSNKYTFEAGVGLTLPTGDTFHYFNTSYAFSVGGGRQFNKHFAVLLQFDYDHFGINGATLDKQLSIYDYGCSNTPAGSTCLGSLDGNNHVWSFTLDPTYTFYQGDKMGAYVVVGAGFYHKVTNFTTPETGEECDPYYGCYEVQENAIVDHYTSNAVGFNGGFGLTYKFSRFADERFFVEGRYVFVDNSQRTGYTYADLQSGANSTYAGSNFFPANSNRTTYIPIKVGVRF